MKILFKLWNLIFNELNWKHFIINNIEINSVLEELVNFSKFTFEIYKIILLDSWLDYIFNKFELLIWI